MKFQNYCISLIADERIIITSAPESPVSPPSETQNVKPNGLVATTSMISAPFDVVVVYDQKNNIDHDRSDKHTFIGSFTSQFISLDDENVNGVPFFPAIISVHAGRMLVLVGQEEKAALASSEIHADRLENDGVNAPNPAHDTVPNGSDLLSVSPGANHPTGAFNFSLFTTVDNSNEVESRQNFAGLHVRQFRVGNEVNSMYDEEQFATPDNGINNPNDAPLSKAESSIGMMFLAVGFFHKYFNKGSDNIMLTRASTRSASFSRPRLAARGMRRTPIMKTLLQVVMLIMTCLPAAMSLAGSVCENDVDFIIPFKGEPKSCQDIGMDDTVRRELCKYETVTSHCPNICGVCCQDNSDFLFPGALTGDQRTCAWITNNVKKTEARRESHCESEINGAAVKDHCQISCDVCFEPVETCFNDAEFLSQEFKGRQRSCKNIRLDESRRNTLCQFDDVRTACPQSCGFCCLSDATYTFKSVDKKTRRCGWISRRNAVARRYKYCDKFLNGATVRDKCPEDCDFCFDPVIQSQSPSSTPNQAPDRNPTMAPTAADTFSPVSTGSPVVLDLALTISGICKITKELEVAMVTGIKELLKGYAGTAEIIRVEENCAVSDENSSSLSSPQSNYQHRGLAGDTVAVEMKVVMSESSSEQTEQSASEVKKKIEESLAGSVLEKCPTCNIVDFTGTQRDTTPSTPVPTKAPTKAPVPAPVRPPVRAPIQPAPVPLPSSKPSVSSIPSLKPSVSIIPSVQPSVSIIPSVQPSVSIIPSVQPSVSSIPSFQPSLSAVPSGAPAPVFTNCVGVNACKGAVDKFLGNGKFIGNGGCVGDYACSYSKYSTIGNGGCVGDYACSDIFTNSIGDGGCVGDYACYESAYNSIRDGGCVGYYACTASEDNIIGDGGCVGYEACSGTRNRIIFDNSCNCDGCCKQCLGDVPPNKCNTIRGVAVNPTDFDTNGYCNYCIG